MPAKTQKTYTPAQKRAYAARMAAARASRSTSSVQGRGFYKGFGRHLGTGLGAAFSAITKVPGGAALGGYLGQKGSEITGFGAYNVPLTQNTLVLPNNPRICNDAQKEGAVVVTHREHIGSVRSSTAFEIQYELELNPARNSSFPWLSAIASNFTQYEFLGVIYEFVSTSGHAVSSTNSSLGEVIMCANYNSLDSSYVNKTQMLNADFCQSFAPSRNGALPIECAVQQSTITRLYTRYGSVPAGADKRLYDLGTVTIATSGMQAADIELGELYVNYQVCLHKPQLVQELGFLRPEAVYQLGIDATKLYPLGKTMDPIMAFDSIGLTLDRVTHTITIPRNTCGKFMLKLQYDGVSIALTHPGIAVSTNITDVPMFADGTITNEYSSGTAGKMFEHWGIMVTDPSQEATITLGTSGEIPTTLNRAELFMIPLNYDSVVSVR